MELKKPEKLKKPGKPENNEQLTMQHVSDSSQNMAFRSHCIFTTGIEGIQFNNINVLSGNDTIAGADGDNIGSAGSDTIFGEPGADYFIDEDDNDYIDGGDDDIIYGGQGNVEFQDV